MVEEITALFRSDISVADREIEKYLDISLQGLSLNDRLAVLTELIASFQVDELQDQMKTPVEADLFAALLGIEMSCGDIAPELLTQRLVSSMRTVLASLGELIDGLNFFMNKESFEAKTIEEVLAASIESPEGDAELTTYLNQIKFAYASMYEGFQQTSHTQIKKMLQELSPEKMSESVSGGLNVGLFRKAQMFDIYCEKHRNLSNYIDRGLFTESLLRSFESESQRAFLKKRGKNG